MQMEMRAREDIEIGNDITAPLPPLCFSLHDSLLRSHCSACFSPLPPLFPPNPPHSQLLLCYCSPKCSNYDSALHLSSAELHLILLLRSRPSSYPYAADTSDLRAALRFLHSYPSTCHSLPTARLAGLLTNHEKLTPSGSSEDYEILSKIRDGARAMAAARRMRDGLGFSWDDFGEFRLEEAALCLVLTNAVEVQDKRGRTLGVAVYGSNFSWINHSCSPNACYRISLPSATETKPFFDEESLMRIVPHCCNEEENQTIESGVCGNNLLAKESQICYGPRIIARSIKRIKREEEVTVAYTDLLQPKAIRQSELWSRYRFLCCCKRCVALPPTYVDRALEEISVVNIHSSCTNSSNFYREKAIQLLNDYVDDAIADYLSIGDAQSCCKKLLHLLTRGLLDEQLECNERTFRPTYLLRPLHHLSLNAYTTLASAYKTCANDLFTLFSEANENLCEAFDMSRTSAAYSLLLAVATNHLFQFEPSLIASVANFWATAGESLLDFSRSSVWSDFLPVLNLAFITKLNCAKCLLREKFEINSFRSEDQYADFENISSKFLECVIDYTGKVWHFLIRGCHHLEVFQDPFDFSSLATAKYSGMWESRICPIGSDVVSNGGTEENIFRCEAQGYTNHGRIYLFQLGVHCLLYGGYLASMCFGEHSYLTSHIKNILNREEILISTRHEPN